MKRIFVSLLIAATTMAGPAFAQTQISERPPANPLAVNPISPRAQTVDIDVMRQTMERAGYTDISDLSRDSIGVWRAHAKKGDGQVDVIVDKGGRIKPEPQPPQ